MSGRYSSYSLYFKNQILYCVSIIMSRMMNKYWAFYQLLMSDEIVNKFHNLMKTVQLDLTIRNHFSFFLKHGYMFIYTIKKEWGIHNTLCR